MSEGERRLLGILVTDIVGYPAMLGADEAKGIEARQEHGRMIRTLASQFHGEFVDESGRSTSRSSPSRRPATACGSRMRRRENETARHW